MFQKTVMETDEDGSTVGLDSLLLDHQFLLYLCGISWLVWMCSLADQQPTHA